MESKSRSHVDLRWHCSHAQKAWNRIPFFFLWTDLTHPFFCLYYLTHYIRISISLSHTSHFSLNYCIYHFRTLSKFCFQSCSLPPLRFPSCLSTSLWHVFSSFTHFLFISFFITAFLFSNVFSMPSSFFFFYVDASVSGWVCSEFLKPHLPLTLWPTCPSCSMWRSRTLEPQFWAPLMSSVCWDTTAMYPSWSKVCKKYLIYIWKDPGFFWKYF